MNGGICFIEIIFENLDCIVIPAHYFRRFEWSIDRTAVKFTEENQVAFELIPEANRDAASFGGDVHCIYTGEGSLFERLQARDITQIKLLHADRTEETIYVAWRDEADDWYTNQLQTSCLSDEGTFCVQIGAK